MAIEPLQRPVTGGARRVVAGAALAVKRFWVKAYEDGITGLAGMVAYNLLLSLLPLALVALFVLGHVLRGANVETSVIADIHRILPGTENSNLTGTINGLERHATTIGVLALLSSVWVGASFWGALDTAFCRIYRSPCRPWLVQKRFALTMLLVTLAFIGLTVGLPALQSAVASGTDDLPFGLNAAHTVYLLTLAGGLLALFAILCLVYRVVPNEPVPWHGIWPGAAGAAAAIAIVEYGFPIYLQNGSTITTLGGTFVFIVIVLLWFYVVALIILGGAVLNALVLCRRDPARSARS
jgi:membrane protein